MKSRGDFNNETYEKSSSFLFSYGNGNLKAAENMGWRIRETTYL